MPSRVRESNTLFASRLKPTVPSNTMDHPSFTFFNCQRILAALELGSEAQLLLNSTQILSHLRGEVVGLGGFEPPTSRLPGVRSNQTEL